MDKTKLRGREGEAAAAQFLRKRGYRLIAQNFHCRFGEIDLIAQKDGYVAFVEVKLRADASFAEAREFVTPSKQRRLRQTALFWISQNGDELQPRFDVIEVYIKNGETSINHLENAFE